MAKDKVTVPGLEGEFSLHPDVKRYTLRDNGFMESKNGKFRLERSLGEFVADTNSPLLKITVDKNIETLKISTTNSKGLKKLDMSNNDRYAENREKAQTILEGLVDENILIKE